MCFGDWDWLLGANQKQSNPVRFLLCVPGDSDMYLCIYSIDMYKLASNLPYTCSYQVHDKNDPPHRRSLTFQLVANWKEQTTTIDKSK